MMKVNITKARVHVAGHFRAEGSVLGQTIQAGSEGFETRLEVESDESPERLAGLIRNAENGCYIMQTIRHPVPVKAEVLVNGAAFDVEAYPPPNPRS
jgi:organic hydroperoxide reductase OsmC/OhrA